MCETVGHLDVEVQKLSIQHNLSAGDFFPQHKIVVLSVKATLSPPWRSAYVAQNPWQIRPCVRDLCGAGFVLATWEDSGRLGWPQRSTPPQKAMEKHSTLKTCFSKVFQQALQYICLRGGLRLAGLQHHLLYHGQKLVDRISGRSRHLDFWLFDKLLE